MAASVMDPMFAPSATLAYAPGTSPYRQKGTAWLGDFELLEEQVPGGMAALRAKLDPALRAWVTGTFRPSEWYDVMPNPLMMQVAARLRQRSFVEHQRDVGRWHAQKGFRGIYRTLLRFVSNENVAVWGPRVSSLYHEFGRYETRVVGPRQVDGVRTGVPRVLVQWVMVTGGAFCEQALLLAGARSARMSFGSPELEDATRDLYRVPVSLTWA